jgi:hypothetical protein
LLTPSRTLRFPITHAELEQMRAFVTSLKAGVRRRPRLFYPGFTSGRAWIQATRVRGWLKHICGSNEGGKKMKRHLFALITACTLGAAVLASPAGADPIHAKNAAQVHALCGTQTVYVVVNGNGTFTPAHVLGSSTSMFIPTAVHLTFSFTPAGGGGPFVDTTNATKAAPLRGTVTCTIPLQTVFSGPQGSATIQGTVTGFYTPR